MLPDRVPGELFAGSCDHCLTRIRFSAVRAALICLFLSLVVTIATEAEAQSWRISTPRDTFVVPANKSSWTPADFAFNANIVVNLKVLGTFGMWPGQNGTGFDARYTYNIPGWLAPYPLIDPPTFNGTSYEIYFEIDTTNGLSTSIFRPSMPGFQLSHIYTGQYTSAGVPFKFHIMDRTNQDSLGYAGYYYKQATGALTVELSQFTPGIAIQTDSLDFGTVLIGSDSLSVDSMASYGVNSLEVDSVRIFGSAAFSFKSQFGDHFSLTTEQTNQFIVSYTPDQKFDEWANLYIFSHNADGPNRVRVIHLHGIGGEPSLAVGPYVLNFGKVRVNTLQKQYANIYDGGNAPLRLTSDSIYYNVGVFTQSPDITPATPATVPQGQNWQIGVSFAPAARSNYSSMMYIRGQLVGVDSVLLMGQGVQPIPILSDSTLYFDSVRRGDHTTDSVTLTNEGDMTAAITFAGIRGPNASAFQMIPNDLTFLLDPDSSRTFSITFAPGTGPEGPRSAYLELDFDDHSSQIVNLLGYEVEPKLILKDSLLNFGKIRVNTSAKLPLPIQNNANVDLPLNPYPYAVPAGTFSILRSPAQLAPLGSDSITVQFLPTVHGPAAAWIHMTADEQFDSIFAIGFGGVSEHSLTLDTIDFGILPISIPSVKSTTLSDSGDYPLGVVSIEIAGKNAGDFTLVAPTPPGPFTLQDSVPHQIAVQFVVAKSLGLVHQAMAVITYEDSSRDTVILLGREESQYVQFIQPSIPFGVVRINRPAVQYAILANGADAALTVGGFSITQSGSAFWPGDTSTTVRALDTSQLPIYFEPTTRGYFTGYLHARNGEIKQDSVLVDGTGAAPIPQFSSTTINFGTVALPGGTAQQPLSLKDIGDWPIVTYYTIQNDALSEFSIAPVVSPDTIRIGATMNYAITFTPKAPRLSHTANLVFTFDDSTTQTILLQGLDEYDSLVVDSSALTFGKVRVANTSTETIHLINTSTKTLTAQTVEISPAGTPFSIAPSGTIGVNPRTDQSVVVTFAPTQRGIFRANLVAFGGNIQNDTIPLTGQGVAPVPVFSNTPLNFGSLYVGNPGTQNTTLTNQGDYDLTITNSTLTGGNNADFTPVSVPSQFVLAPDSSLAFVTDFLATTPLQGAARKATLNFIEDDGSVFSLPMTEIDKQPDGISLGFEPCSGRPGDILYSDLVIQTPIPDSANLHEISGIVTFDTTVAELLAVTKGLIDTLPNWVLTYSTTRNGKNESLSYDLKDDIDTLYGNVGSVLRLKFLANVNAKPGATTTLNNSQFIFHNTKQITPQGIDAFIVIDSSCAPTHLQIGTAIASFVQPNYPNPFGALSGSSTTSIPFDIADDNTSVTIRIIDVTGKEVLRPVDNQIYNNGHYSITLDSRRIGTGMFFYEFEAGGDPPQLQKMIVTQ